MLYTQIKSLININVMRLYAVWTGLLSRWHSKAAWGWVLPQSNPLPAKPAMSFISFAPGASSKLGIKKPLT